jgi:hypothetical protein
MRRLKYLSINALIGGPNFQIMAATTKKRVLRPIIDAAVKSVKSNLKTPEAIVNIL